MPALWSVVLRSQNFTSNGTILISPLAPLDPGRSEPARHPSTPGRKPSGRGGTDVGAVKRGCPLEHREFPSRSPTPETRNGPRSGDVSPGSEGKAVFGDPIRESPPQPRGRRKRPPSSGRHRGSWKPGVPQGRGRRCLPEPLGVGRDLPPTPEFPE